MSKNSDYKTAQGIITSRATWNRLFRRKIKERTYTWALAVMAKYRVTKSIEFNEATGTSTDSIDSKVLVEFRAPPDRTRDCALRTILRSIELALMMMEQHNTCGTKPYRYHGQRTQECQAAEFLLYELDVPLHSSLVRLPNQLYSMGHSVLKYDECGLLPDQDILCLLYAEWAPPSSTAIRSSFHQRKD